MSIIHDFSDPRSFYPNNLSEYCLVGGESGTFFQGDELSPEVWTLTNSLSLVATSFASLAISIILIGFVISSLVCVISSLVCGVATLNKALKSWLGAIYVFDFVIILVLMLIDILVHLYTIVHGNRRIGGDTNCERYHAYTIMSTVIPFWILVKEYAFLSLHLDFIFFISEESSSKRRILVVVMINSIAFFSLYLVLSLLTAYFNLTFCVWSLPGMFTSMYMGVLLSFFWLLFLLLSNNDRHKSMKTLPPIRTLKEFPTDIIKHELTRNYRLFYSTELVYLFVEPVLCLILLVPVFFVELNEQSVLTMVLVFLLWLVYNCVKRPLKTVIHTQMQRKVIKKLYLQIKKIFSCMQGRVDLFNEPLIIENRTIINHLKDGNLAAVEQLIETGNIGMEFQDHSDRNKLKTALILSSQHGHTNLVKTLLQAGAGVDQVVEGDLTTALEYACFYGHDSVVKVLLKNGSKPNGIDKYGKATGIPLAEAVKQHHGNIVKMLLLHGADPNMVDCHLGAIPMKWITRQMWWYNRRDSMRIWRLLLKAGAVLSTKGLMTRPEINKRLHFRKRLSFYTRKSVVVIGNSQHGKTTLVASLRNEGRCLKKLVNRIKKMNIITERTAGIETVPFDSKKYGRVLFFDFAGQEAYHGPHQAFLRALLPRPGVSLSFLMLVKSTDPESTILSQLKRWLQPLISIPNVPENVKVKVILVGQRCLDQFEEIDQSWLEFGKPCVLDCRYSESPGIDYLRDQINSVTSYEQSSIETSYNLHWVVASIKKKRDPILVLLFK